MAAKKMTGRSADASAGAAAARKLAAAAKIAQVKADEAKAKAVAAKKKVVASQASDAVGRRYQSSTGPKITNKYGQTMQNSYLKDKQSGVTRTTETFLDQPKGSEFRNRVGFSANNAKTKANLLNKKKSPKHSFLRDSFYK